MQLPPKTSAQKNLSLVLSINMSEGSSIPKPPTVIPIQSVHLHRTHPVPHPQ